MYQYIRRVMMQKEFTWNSKSFFSTYFFFFSFFSLLFSLKRYIIQLLLILSLLFYFAQSVGGEAVENTECTSAER